METDPFIIPEIVSAPTILGEQQPDVDSRGGVEISEKFHSLDARNIRLDQIASLIFSTVLLTGIIIALLVLWANLGMGPLWFSFAAGAILVVVALYAAAWFWPPISHRHASWCLDQEGLEIRRGVLWRHQITIPLGRVQHADVSQGPFQRMYELGTLTVHTAGTQNASVEIQGLAHTTAIELRDKIVQQRKDQNVV